MKKQTLEKLIKSETTIQSKYYHDVLHTFLAGMVAAGVLLTISSNTPVHAAANDTNDVKTSLTMSSSNSSSSNQVTSSSVSSSSESANSATDEEDTNKSTDSTASSNASKAESVSDSKTSQDAQQTSANSQSSSQVSSSSSSAVSSSETVTNNSSSNENNVVAENSSSVASTALSTKDQNNSAVTNKKVLAAADTQVDSWEIGDASRPRVDAVDVSSYQDGMTQANFNELKAKGVKTVIVKVTEGNNYTNPYASQEINYAQNAGLNIMVYHYATFNSTDSAKQEANYLLQELNTLSLAKTTRIFADMEDVGTSSDDVKDNLLNFFNVLNAAGYTDHAAYAYLNYQYLAQVIAAVGKQNIWLAQYPYTPSASNLKNTDYGAWQDSSQTELSGYDGYLDSSIDYNGLVVYQTANNGFIHQDANVYYYENNTKVTGQKKINNYWYYFDDATGAMVTGFKTIINQNKTVYYNSNGQMQYGKQQINGHWYLFDSILGSMKTGFQYIANQNKTVYYNNNGQMQYGQQQVNGHWYLFDNTSGAMKTGFQYIANQNKTVYYNNSGQMQYGQQQINGHWYLFDNTTGAMKTGFQYIANQNKTVYYNNNGQMQYGQQQINGHWYLFDSILGSMKTGFQYIANQNKTVYYNNNGQMQYGQQQINGHWYLFDSILGSMKTGFQYIANQNKTVYYNNNGQMQYGQQQINGHWYLFDNTTGAMKTGFQYIANQNKTVYYNNNGQMQYGQQKINGHWYLFDNTTGAMKTGFQIINNQNKIVYYANNGQIQYGNQVINGQHYNFDNITGALANQSSISLKLYNAHFAAKTSQVVVTVANYRTSASVYLYSKDKNGIWVQNWQTNGYVGGSGVGEAHEGSSRTPIGAYSLGFAFGTHSGVMSSLGYRKIDSKSYWIEDVNDSQYNTWQERSWSKSPSEHLIDYQVQYEYAIVINYNMNPIVKGKGSGFFIHVANGHATAGCVSIPRGQVISLIETLKSGAYIVNVNNINQISNY